MCGDKMEPWARGIEMIISGVDCGKKRDPRGPRAKAAREWFARTGPSDAQPLPLGYNEREWLKHGGVDHIAAWFSRSLAWRDYEFDAHPSFDDYARGLMACEFTGNFVKDDEELQKRFPPRALHGIGPDLIWEPPKQHAKTMTAWRNSLASVGASRGNYPIN